MPNLGKEILVKEFSLRKRNNSLYSLRAFARDLDINRTTLSEVMSEKRQISKKNAEKLTERLSLTPIEKNALMSSCDQNHEVGDHHFLQIQEDVFQMISEWYYLAVLSLSKIPQCSSDPDWIAHRLGITAAEAKMCLDRLERLGFLEIQDGVLKRTVRSLSTHRDVPSQAVRNYHKQILGLAQKALDDIPVELREFSAVTMEVDPENIPRAKEILMKCKRKVAKLLSSGRPTEVYHLGLQFFPLSRKKELC